MVPHSPGLSLHVNRPTAENIGGVIADLKTLDLKPDILVVNDGSWDGTYEAAKTTRQALVVNLPNNLGIGGAVQTGFKWAARNGYRVAIQFDGDGQHIAAEVPKLLNALEEQKAGMVIGSRFIEKHSGYRSTFIRRLGIRVFKAINSLLIGQTITDNTSGFRAYDRRTIELLARHYPTDYPEPEVVILLGKNGFSIAEVFTRMQERQGGGSSITGFKGLYYMVKVLLAILMTALRKPLTGAAKHLL
ncbi:MAG: glycosyltransferase family 2 protein [Desulfuromonadales bacterium]